jgi:Rrf2 family transcriptional regulator, nitric oxide-sensitive transcriptional repressor
MGWSTNNWYICYHLSPNDRAMRLTRFSDIGLRALMYLGAHAGRTVPTAEISNAMNVSHDHLMKCLQALDALGVVRGTRGRGGGFELSAAGRSIRLGDLVRRLEPSLALAECFEPDSSCPLTGSCRLADALGEAQRAFFAALDRHTLADLLLADRSRLVQLGGPRVAAHH